MGGADDAATGVLLLDKPPGPTSHDAVDRVRRALGTRSVGHTGTLDPFASGLLVLCAGRATRLAEYFHLPSKTYSAVLRLGVETATHDPEGEVVAESDGWRDVDEPALRIVMDAYTGRVDQVPPVFSAKSVDGRRAHRAAREGDVPELEAEKVVVHELTLEAFDPPEVRISCRVSTGTYVRALARDVGRALGCGAHLRSLRRTAVGPYPVERALAWDALADAGWRDAAGAEPPAWLRPAESLPWLPIRELTPAEADRVTHGSRIPRGDPDPPRWRPAGAAPGEASDGGELPVLLVREGRLVAVAEAIGTDLQPRKVWPDAA